MLRRKSPSPRPLATSLARYSSAAAMFSALALAGGVVAEAAQYFWDPGVTGTGTAGGAGTWNASTANFFNGADVVWPNTNPNADEAVFAGAGGIVTLGAPIFANKLTFNSGGYSVVDGGVPANTLTLSGTAPGITVTNAADTASIGAVLAGTAGLSKLGAGTLALSGVNTFTGTVTVSGGILSVGADANLGAAANGLTLDGGTLSVGGSYTSGRVVTLGAGGGSIGVTVGNNLTLSAGLAANANALTKIDAGTLTLSAASTRTGVTAVTGGRLSIGNIGALGNGDVTVSGGATLASTAAAGTFNSNVILNNGTFSNTAAGTLTLLAGKAITIGTGTNTVDVSGGSGSGFKINLAAAGQLTGSGTFTKTGGGDFQLGFANAGFTGQAIINAGILEVQNPDALGTGTTTITMNGGEFVSTGVAIRHNFVLNSGATLSANGTVNAATYSGAINVAGDANLALRYFQTTATANGFTISGPLSGSGNLNVTAPAAATLSLAGSTAAYTGVITAGPNAIIGINQLSKNANIVLNGGGISYRLPNAIGAAPGLEAIYYSFGFDPDVDASLANATRGEFASDLLSVNPRAFSRIDPNINIPNGGNGTFPVTPVPGYEFNVNDGAMWRGILNVTTAGSYQFNALDDDGATLFIDGVQIGSVGVISTGANLGTAQTLTAGPHNIVYKFGQGGGGGYTVLRYQGPDSGNTMQTIPASAFTHATARTQVTVPNLPDGVTTFLDILQATETPTLTFGSGSSLTVTSTSIDTLTVTGLTTLTGGNSTITTSTGGISFNGGISGTGNLTFVGNYLRSINAPSTFTGSTTVTGGELDLNATGGVAIPGDLTVNVSNTALTAVINNVNLKQSDQIADSATVTMTSGVLNMGSNLDSILALNMNGGRIAGTGKLILGNLGGSVFTSGTIEVGLGGAGTLNKTGTGLLVLAGAGNYTGTTTITAGAIQLRNGTGLGASGAGNDTTIAAGAQLQILGSLAMAEDITSNDPNGIRILGGNSTNSGRLAFGAGVTSATLAIGGGGLNLTGPISIDGAAGNTSITVTGAGELGLGAAPTLGTGTITKTGTGTLSFNYNTNGVIPANLTFTSGALGFGGTQTGTFTAPVAPGKAYKFNSDPGAGASIVAAAGSTVIAGFAPDQAFLGRFTPASAGALVLTGDTANNLNFSAGPNLSLGARGLVTYSGAITPNGTTYNLGGGFATDSIQNILAVTQPLTGANGLKVIGSNAVDLSRVANTFSGPVTIDGGTVIFNNTSSFGDGSATNTITLANGGIMRMAQTSGSAGQILNDLGYSPSTGTTRTIAIGTGGGGIDVPSRVGGDNSFVISEANGLTGAAGTTLTKTGLGFMIITNVSPFAGDIVLAGNSNQFDIRSLGSLANVNSITINQNAVVNLDNNNGLGAGRTPAYAGAYNGNRINDAATITMSGGSLLFTPRGAAGQTAETIGTLNLNAGLNALNFNSNPGGTLGSDFTVTKLVHNTGGTLAFGRAGTPGTFGAAGANNTRVVINNLQLGTGTAAAPVDDQILAFADLSQGQDIVQYELTTAPASVRIATYVAQVANTPTTSFNPPAGNSNVYRIDSGTTTAGAANITTLTPFDHGMGALKFNSGDTNQTLAFSSNGDILTIGTENSFGGAITATAAVPTAARVITIGSTVGNGQITGGIDDGDFALKELFFHFRGNNGGSALTMTVNSTIIDNGFSPLAVVKDEDGTLTFAGPNPYSGGTYVDRGRLIGNVAGSLGTGAVLVKNAGITLPVAGTVSGGAISLDQPVFTIADQSELFLNSAIAYNNLNDRFDLGPGSNVAANSNAAGQGLNSLTYVAAGAPFTGGGQIRLAPGAVVRSTSVLQNADIGTLNMIQGLPNTAQFFFNSGSTNGDGTTLTLGTGTPWRGIGAGRTGATFTAGTIFLNSDVEFNGTTTDGANQVVNLGSTGIGTYNIVNLAGKPVNVLVTGTVAMGEGSVLSMSPDVTFVVSDGAILQPNLPNQFGSGANVAKLLVQSGGTLDPGNFVVVGSAANQPQGVSYPVPGPINASQTLVEAGGRLLVNDASGLGTSPVGSIQMKTNSVLDIGNNQAFLGANNGLINPGQIVFDPGVVVRLTADNIFRLNTFVSGAPNGDRVVLEVFNANRSVTDATNPMIVAAPGTPQIEAFDITIGNGGIITNDASDRQINERRGHIILNNGAVLAGTNQTYLNVQEGLNVAPGATITIGSTRTIDGQAKLGGVQLNGPNSNVIPNDASIVLLNGTQLAFGAVNVFPDTHSLDLPFPVTSFPGVGGSAVQPGNGTSLLLNAGNFVEIIGPLTGTGAIIANGGGMVLGTGFGATSDFTFAGVIKSTNGQNPSLLKIGPTKMTLTGTSDSTTDLISEQGTLQISGAGSVKSSIRAMKGASIVIDNSVTAQNNRTNGNGTFWIPSGGSYNLIGNATVPVTESFANLANSVGAFGGVNQVPGVTSLKITPGAATTTLFANSSENFQSAGIGQQRSGTWVLNSPTISNGPVTISPSGAIVANPTNNNNGLIQIALPAFGGGVAFFGLNSGQLLGSPGTQVARRPDYLGDANGDGIPEGFMTQDGLVYPALLSIGSTTVSNLATTTGLSVGMPVSGTGIPANTTIASIIDGTSLTLSQAPAGATTPTFINVVSGGMRLLTNAEYATGFRDNQTVGLNVKVAGTINTSGDTRVSTITLTPGSTININGTLPNNPTASRLHLNDGGVFVQPGGTATINGGTSGSNRNFLQANTGASLFLHTLGDLNLNAEVMTDNAIVKTGGGTLNVGDSAFSGFRGSLQIDAGVVNLGPNNGFANIRGQNGFTTNENLFINGGTLNLNGNSEFVNRLDNNNPLPGMGGTVTSNAPATLTVNGGGIFSGSVGGQISLDKTTNNTLLLTSDNPYTGSTLIRSGTLALRDSAKLSGTSGVEVQNATLQFDDSYISNIADRISASTPITLKGATVNLTGAAGQVATQTFNTLTLAAGLNQFTSNAGGSGSNVIQIGNLVRPVSGGATINYQQNYGFVGAAGNTSSSIRHLITNVNGAPLALNDGIIGGWSIVNGDNFATYLPTLGVGALGNTADGFANYDSTDATAATATQNVNDGTARTFTVSKTINAWRIVPNAVVAMTFNSGVGLTLDTGGLLINNNNTTSFNAATGASGNFITSNSGELVAFVNQNTAGINIPITGAINFVKSGVGAINIRPESTFGTTAATGVNVIPTTTTTGLVVGQPVSGTGIPAGTTITAINPGVSFTISQNTTAAVTAGVQIGFGNTYTGPTIVNGGTMTLNMGAANSAARAIPGDLIINNATVTEANVAGQLSPTANITITGGGRFNAVSAAGAVDTIGSITVNDVSGTSGTTNIIDRTVTEPNSTVNLSAATAITVNNTNPATVPFIGAFAGLIGFTNATGSTLNINSPTTVNGLGAVGLRIDGQIAAIPTGIAGGGLIKTGNGILALSPGTNPTFAAGVTTVGSNVITVTSTAGLVPGQEVTGTNIPAGSYVVSVTDGTTFSINQNTTVAGTGITITGQVINQFGNPTALTDVLNVQSGILRADLSGALGNNFANTTIQNGAVLLGANSGSQVITGSVKMNAGSTLGATINSFTLGAATLTAANQSVFNVAGAATIVAYDYFVPATNNGNITINGRFTGSGNINLFGSQITQGNGGGGVIAFGNPIISGSGASDYSGTITVGPNSILQSQAALIAGSGITRTTGNELGTATINLNGGRLRLRDDLDPAADVSNLSITYGNNVTLLADSYIDSNRQTSASAVNNTINLGVLSVPSGSKTLTVDSGNNYGVGFSMLSGPGTLIKGGNSPLSFAAIDTTPGNIPSLGIAGPVGNVLAGSIGNNINFTPGLVGLQNLSVNGFYTTPATKTLNITGAVSVNPNPGNVTGMLAVDGSTTLVAASFVNNGQVGAANAPAIITAANGFSGNGFFLSSTGQTLTLAGSLNAPGAKIAGVDAVVVTGSTNAANGLQVQSGTLRFAPNTNGTSSGNIQVLSSPASVGGPSTAPIAATSGTLEFDAPLGGTITHTGDITNSGLVRASIGTTTVAGMISGTAPTYAPGLLEGYTIAPGGALNVADTRVENPGNFGIRLEPRMLQMNAVTQQALTGHTDNDTWIYTGYVKDDDGIFSFAENIDDRAAVWIDGALVLNAANGGTSRVVSTAYSFGQTGNVPTAGSNLGIPSQNFGPGIALPGFGSGWHLVEIRMNNGVGGSGPISGNGFGVNYGFGYKNGIAALDGGDMIKPVDNGTGNLFVTPVGGKGNISVNAGAKLTATGFTQTGVVTLDSASGTELEVNGSNVASKSDSVVVTGGASGSLKIATTSSITTGILKVSPTATLNVNGGGTFKVNGIPDLPDLGNTGAVTVLGSTLAGTGTILGPVTLTTSVLAPGDNGIGTLTTGGLSADSGSLFSFQLGGSGLADQVSVTGNTLDLGSATLSLSVVSQLTTGDILKIVLNSGTDTNFGLFAGLPSGSLINTNGGQVRISYFDNPLTPAFETAGTPGVDPMTSVSLLVTIPEPSSALNLLAGLGGLVGLRRFRRRR